MLENTKTILQISTVEERQKKNEMFDTDINFNLSSLLGFCVVWGLCPRPPSDIKYL
jgi:hypothetical protein